MPKARVRRLNKKLKWCFEPSYCRPPAIVQCVTPTEDTNSYRRSMRSSWFEEMVSQPANTSAPRVRDATNDTHDHLFGFHLPPAAVRRRRGAGDSCDGPRWSPRDCPRPPSVDDFTRTHRNIHGDNQPTLKSAPPADFNEPRTTILGPYLLPPVCCPHSDATTSPVRNEEFERTKYNVFGPHEQQPLRLPVRTDDFINSNRNLFGPATTIPLRKPQRTTDFDDTRRNVFGPHLPISVRPSVQVHENTFDHLFGKTIVLHPPRTVTPPLALRQNINVLSMTGRSHTPPRFQPRPEMSFDNTYSHLFGRDTPVTPKVEHRQGLIQNTWQYVQRVGLFQ